jgi:hypothetical protein
VAGTACGKPPPPPDLDNLIAQLDLARSDSQLASDAVATAKPEMKPALSAVAADRSKHAQALSDEIARMTGTPSTSTSATTTTSPAQATPPTTNDVVAALRKSADSATQLTAQLSGYRSGLLGSIAASCTAAYKVALV